ncbi:cytochrome P450 [Alicyclobacillus tolerans]|uniref:cytochrome P450 n=1 Tax=Alicyclobacillus tolerans TaxID=90970 RepID=UPI001F36A1AF|nr:cytochrome P450 [Alicyclobacillus tolerans]MCF8566726.1 cytochrome P450 [Alicyclobacillus tolerans]
MSQTAGGIPGVMVPVTELVTPQARLNPFEWYEDMRRHSPVRYDEARQSWDVFLYEDVDKILRDHVTFSSVRPKFGPNLLGSVLSSDPPKHSQLRNIVSQAFTPRTVQEMEPRIQSICDNLLDDVAAQGTMDLVRDFSYPLPVIVIAEMLGVPSSDHHLFKKWSDVIAKGASENSMSAIQSLLAEKAETKRQLDDYFSNILAERKVHPGDDLITKLVQAEVDGERLSQDELLEFCILLLAAGNETTTNLITNAIRSFVEERDLQEKLRKTPEAIDTATEEVLRFYSPIQATNRYATADVDLRGNAIRAGQQVVIWMGSANRDEAQFPNAAEFVADRSPNKHIAFGHGIHFCLGAPLARLEAHVALPTLLRRLQRMELVPGSSLKPIPSSLVYGVSELHIQFAAV